MTKSLSLIAFVLIVSITASAQSISKYLFSSLSGTYAYLPTTATAPALASGSANEGLYPNIPIGFDFFYLGRRVNTVQPSTNGWLILGPNVASASVAANNFNSFSLPSDFVAPLWDDLDMSSGTFRYQTSGTAPNRIFTAEWRNVEWNWNTNTSVISFQVKLFETTGVIQFEYAQESGSVAGASASIGIRGFDNSSSNAFISLTNASGSPTSSTSISTNNINSKPANGQIYRFSNGNVNAPLSFNTNSRTINSMNVTWVDNSANETGFVIYRSTDNINFVYDGMVLSNTTSYTVQNLISGTTYFYRVHALNEGRLSTPLTGSASTLAGTLSGVINVPGNYSTITSALNALRTNGMAASVTIQLNPTYNNALETYPITVDGIGTAANRTLTIRPASNVTSLVLSSPANTSVFAINNTKNFIIDGRPGGVGTTRALTLLCNNGINTIALTDDCSNDTIRFCKIALNDNGNGYFPFSSNISFYSAGGFTTGCSNNAITNNEIYGINPPSSLITFACVGAPVTCQNNVINNNLMYDFSGNLRFFNTANGAVYIEGNVSNFTISGNNIYETQSISSNAGGNIYILSGIKVNSSISSNFTINNNIIGGSNSSATGSPWELGPVSDFNGIIPIDVTVQGTSNFTISGNTLRNYFLGSSAQFGGFPAFAGIKFTSFSKATGVTISNNNIGRDTGNTSISIVNEGTSPMLVTGILIDAPDTSSVTCSGNAVGSFQLNGPTSNNGYQFIGICMQSSGTVSNNLVGSLTTANSIIALNTASNSNQTVTGISTSFYQNFALRNEVVTISGNTVSGLRNNYNVSGNIDRVVGIEAVETRGISILSNTIQNLTGVSSAQNNQAYPVKGIQLYNASFANVSASPQISGNVIRNLNNLATTGSASVCGIFVNSISAATYELSRNFVHSFQLTSSSSTSQVAGFVLQEGETRVVNNMVRLGINSLGQAIALPASFVGIDVNSPAGSTLWHNSVYIGGTISNSASSTYALRRNGNGALVSVNNVLVNQRTFTTGTIKRNFVIGLASSSFFTSSNNCYFRSGAGTALAEVGSQVLDTISSWRSVVGSDPISGVVNPNFVNPLGNSQTVDLHVFGTTPIESNGVSITAVTVDFDGQLRSGLTPNDIGADAGIFTFTQLPVKWVSFDVKKWNENTARIEFTVANQFNNERFLIQRSTDGVVYETVNTIQGAGTSAARASYSYLDNIAGISAPVVYYLVKQIDVNGSSSSTEVKSLKLDMESLADWSAYPNPFNEQFTIDYPVSDADVTFSVYDINGTLLYSQTQTDRSGSYTFTTSSWTPGIYYVRCNNQKTIKVVKLP